MADPAGGTPGVDVEVIRERMRRGASPFAWQEWARALLGEVDRLRAALGRSVPQADACCEQQKWRGICNCFGIEASYKGTAVEIVAGLLRLTGCLCLTCRTRDAEQILAALGGRSVPAEPTPHGVLRDDDKLRLIEMHDWYSRPHSPDSPCIKYVEEIRFLLSLLVDRGAPPQGEPPTR